MNGYNFTERIRKVLHMAREEAANRHHEFVGTEHLLLALIREDDGVAVQVLQHLTADPSVIALKVDQLVKAGQAASMDGPDLPYTSRAKKVLELAMIEARELNHSYIGTEHLLLGLIREERGIAARVLAAVGVTLDAARIEVARLLGQEIALVPPPPPQPHPQVRAYDPVPIAIPYFVVTLLLAIWIHVAIESTGPWSTSRYLLVYAILQSGLLVGSSEAAFAGRSADWRRTMIFSLGLGYQLLVLALLILRGR